jgi:O-antigen biosynthesis protein
MIIFARKHFSGGKAGIFAFIIHLAIYFRAFISIFKRIFEKIYLPILDAVLIFVGFLFITPVWEKIRFEPGHYPSEFLQIVVPVYVAIWLGGILFSGGYKKPVSLFKILRGLLWGTIAILLIYSLVDEDLRFSRVLILLGAFWSVFSILFSRLLFHWLRIKEFRLDVKKAKRIAIVGHSTEATRVKNLLEDSQIQSELAGFIAIDNTDRGQNYIGQIEQLSEIIRINRINEIIFCAENISSAQIIRAMLDLTQLDVEYKIAPPESISIIGSNSIHTAGDLYVVNINAISKAGNQRKKRMFDIGVTVICLFLSPALLWFYNQKLNFINNIFSVLWGKKSWIGYIPNQKTTNNLPVLKPGILHPGDLFPELSLDDEKVIRLNMLYAKDYSISTDTEILFKGWRNLER